MMWGGVVGGGVVGWVLLPIAMMNAAHHYQAILLCFSGVFLNVICGVQYCIDQDGDGQHTTMNKP